MKKRHSGTVIANKCLKTVRVNVERVFRHSQYGKTLRRTIVCYADDHRGLCSVGDVVEIVESRPLSRLKRWVVVQVVNV